MEKFGIYTWWHYFRKGEVSGQVATLITLAIAIIFLFVAVTLNVSRVSQKKTVTSKAADGAALKLASNIGSYANKLSWEYFGGGTGKCQRRWGTFFAILATVVLVALGQWWAAAIALTGAILNETVFEPKIAQRMQRQLNKLPLGLNLAEQAVMYALRNSVNDPAKVVDIHDYDEDGDTTDKINRFSQWYAQRVDALIDAAQAQGAKIDSFIPQVEDFAQEADDFRQDFSEDATRALLIEGEEECPECDGAEAPEVFAEQDGEFITLLEDLDKEDLKVSFWIKDVDPDDDTTYDEVDRLSKELNTFYLWALGEEGGLLQQDFDAIVQMYDMWMPQLYEPEEKDAWYDTWKEQAEKIDNWRPELYGVISQLDEMISEETDPDREDYLRDLQDRTASAIRNLDDFQDILRDFNIDILVSYNQNEDFGDKHQATYSWHDSLGWHHVRVEVSKFTMPRIEVTRSSSFFSSKICIHLRNHSGDVTVKVGRFDEATSASFARRGSTPLWKFRYIKDAQAQDKIDPANPEQVLDYGIKSETRAHYTYNHLPNLVSVR